jgi:hypothetical protein
MIRIFLVIIILIVIYGIYKSSQIKKTKYKEIKNEDDDSDSEYYDSDSEYYDSDEDEHFGNIGTPFYDGLSEYQIGGNTTANDTLNGKNIPISSTRDSRKKNIYKPYKLNKYFVQTQFNDSYRDVMTAFNDIAPDQKNMFNIQMLPVTTTIFNPDKMPPFDCIKLVDLFINNLNKVVMELPQSAEILNDFNNYLPLTAQLNKYVKNKGINEFYKEIGVNYNLYADTPPNAPVRLVRITKMEKQYTEEQTKYVITFVMKKILKSVHDQIQITVHFVYKNDENEFEGMFNNIAITNEVQPIVIELIFVNGYYSNDFNIDVECYSTTKEGNNSDSNDFYEFNALKNPTVTQDHYILKELNKKKEMHKKEMDNFNVNIPYPVYQNNKFCNSFFDGK